MPRPVIFEGRRLPASYANFYIANGAVLVPVFNDPNDRVALNTLAEAIPHPRDRADLFRRPDLGIRRAALHDAATSGSRHLAADGALAFHLSLPKNCHPERSEGSAYCG